MLALPGGWVSYATREHVQPDGVVEYEMGGEHHLPPELVLRGLLTLDTTSQADVLEFLRHGTINISAADLGVGLWFQPPESGESGESGEAPLTHMGDIALILRCIQACACHLVCHLRSEPVHRAWEFMQAEDHLGAPYLLDTVEGRRREEICWGYFERIINAGLTRHPPFVAVLGKSIGTPIYPVCGLFSALCIQLVNVIVDELPIRDCANETCQNVFQRQSGRARKGQYRTEGVKFCSSSCARAQAQRELRRRKKAANSKGARARQ